MRSSVRVGKRAKSTRKYRGAKSPLAALFKEAAIPGASVALIENGKIVFEKSYGYADVEKKIPATKDTPFRAGSISKGITSIAFMTLVEQGRLALDTPLHQIAPEITFNNRWETTNPIRLVHLLEHTTGWPDISTQVLTKDEAGWSTRQGVEFASAGFTSRWQPGMFSVYNNAGPAVVGYVMEKVTGKTFDAYVRQSVLRPMGMAEADFSLTPALASHIAKSYAQNGQATPYQHIVLKPAGSLNASVHELAQLARFYIGRGTVDGQQILRPESVARIERAESNLGAKFGFFNAYGLGNTPIADSGITFHGHNGSIDSFTSVLGYTQRNGSGYVLMANGGEGVDFAGPAAHLIQSWLTRGLKLEPPPAVEVSEAQLKKYAGYYRTITPSNDLLRPYAEIFGWSHVSATAGKLVVGGKDFLATGQHSFRRADRSEATLGFVEQAGEVFKINAISAQQKEPLWRIAARGLVAISILISLVMGIVMLIPWALAWRKGRFIGERYSYFRLLPLAGGVTLIVTLALPLMAYMSDSTSVHQLANIGPYSLVIFACSMLYPLLALAGLLLAFKTQAAPRFIRAYVGFSSLGLICFAAYAATIGWLPLRTWVM